MIFVSDHRNAYNPINPPKNQFLNPDSKILRESCMSISRVVCQPDIDTQLNVDEKRIPNNREYTRRIFLVKQKTTESHINI